MRDAAGQPADGLHLLRLLELRFERRRSVTSSEMPTAAWDRHARPTRIRPAPLSHRIVPSGQIARFQREFPTDFSADASVSTVSPVVGMNALDEGLDRPAGGTGSKPWWD